MENEIPRDRGCRLHPSCLHCPLPKCVEDEPRGQQRLRMAARKKEMAKMKRSGKSVVDIAKVFKVSKRTVERALAR